MDFASIGREAIWPRLESALDVGSVLLEGGRGVGKTALLERAAVRGLGSSRVPYFDIQGATTAREVAQRMAKSLSLARSGMEELVAKVILLDRYGRFSVPLLGLAFRRRR